jgi:hypothetical protein
MPSSEEERGILRDKWQSGVPQDQRRRIDKVMSVARRRRGEFYLAGKRIKHPTPEQQRHLDMIRDLDERRG